MFFDTCKYIFLVGKGKEFMETFLVRDIKQTKKLAKYFSKLLKGGEVILLNGDLGAGKTTFVKFVLRAMGIKDNITSPTFTLMNMYKSKKFDIFHFDMYRLGGSDEAIELGFDEYLCDENLNNIVFVEWSENVKDLLNGKYIVVNITNIDENIRKFEISR